MGRADLGDVAGLWRSPEVMRLLGGPRSPEDARRAADAFIAAGGTVTEGGVCGVRWTTDASPAGVRERELVVLLWPWAWGRGLALAAAREARAGEPGPVVALTQAANVRSRALLGRLCFVEDGSFERFGAPQVRFVRTGMR